jgi:hypothetical protein
VRTVGDATGRPRTERRIGGSTLNCSIAGTNSTRVQDERLQITGDVARKGLPITLRTPSGFNEDCDSVRRPVSEMAREKGCSRDMNRLWGNKANKGEGVVVHTRRGLEPFARRVKELPR